MTTAEMTKAPERETISMILPKQLLVRVDELAAGELISRSAWLRRTVAEKAGVLVR
jgi:metal-responsive CopG/Arc/MetJ family transcriptional regulator